MPNAQQIADNWNVPIEDLALAFQIARAQQDRKATVVFQMIKDELPTYDSKQMRRLCAALVDLTEDQPPTELVEIAGRKIEVAVTGRKVG